jgi:hypothetical protein
MSQHKIPNVGILSSDRSAYANASNVLLAKTGNLQRPEEKIVGEDSSIKIAHQANIFKPTMFATWKLPLTCCAI